MDLQLAPRHPAWPGQPSPLQSHTPPPTPRRTSLLHWKQGEGDVNTMELTMQSVGQPSARLPALRPEGGLGMLRGRARKQPGQEAQCTQASGKATGQNQSRPRARKSGPSGEGLE